MFSFSLKDMKNTKLIQILLTLDKKELNSFVKFVASPFFNTDLKLLALSKYIAKNLHKDPKHLEKNLVFRKVFPKASYTESSKRVITSNLYKLLKRFIEYSFIGCDDYETAIKGQLRSLDFYLEKELFDLFEKQLEETKKFQAAHPFKNHQHNYHNYLLSAKEARYLSGYRKNYQALSHLIDNLDTFYLSCKFKFSALQLTLNKTLSTDSELPFMQEVLYYYQNNKRFQSIPSIVLFYHAVLIIQEENNEQHFEKYEAIFKKHISTLPKSEAKNLYVYASNFCWKQINKGNTQYYEQLFKLCKIAIKEQILYNKNNKLTTGNLKNIISISIILNKISWAEDFLENHKDRLLTTEPEKTYHFNLAALAYHKKQYEKVLTLLADKYEDPFYNIKAKIFRIKIYYAMDDIDNLEKAMNSFRVFMSEGRIKGISTSYQESFRNFINFLYRINSVNTYKNEVRINALVTEIKDYHPLFEKKWMLAILEEMR